MQRNHGFGGIFANVFCNFQRTVDGFCSLLGLIRSIMLQLLHILVLYSTSINKIVFVFVSRRVTNFVA
ncbi:hypothetical protein HanXRQr2_Chr04g0156181 [Helianthus annuus]|uniref:Uncharacterized protein n=1 Tax=Helianthus annuus TaxID=4232 RepID=A0A9K3J6J6_HELAN|nr:hypothetical protein HanXRQr2_Chr04g0156181 [Helianthus annuus]KAJ0930514.1 hypothetical protein HanPSC8_Chr04g0150191 [Helianthus annuus]